MDNSTKTTKNGKILTKTINTNKDILPSMTKSQSDKIKIRVNIDQRYIDIASHYRKGFEKPNETIGRIIEEYTAYIKAQKTTKPKKPKSTETKGFDDGR